VEKDARGLTPEPYTVRVWEGPQPYTRVGVGRGDSGPLGPGLYAGCWMRTSENAFLPGTRANKDNREDRLTQVV
jgi:hypothetical protein